MTSKELGRSTPFARLLSRLSNAFHQAKIPYMVFGGQAVMLHGEPRFTQNIDITLGVDPSSADNVLQVVGKLKLKILVDDPRAFLEQTFILPVCDSSSGIRIDLVFSLSEFERQAIERALSVKIGRTQVKFVNVEDLLILKTIAGRPRDLEDIRGILAKNPSYEKNAVLFWLREYDCELGEGYEERFLSIAKQIDYNK